MKPATLAARRREVVVQRDAHAVAHASCALRSMVVATEGSVMASATSHSHLWVRAVGGGNVGRIVNNRQMRGVRFCGGGRLWGGGGVRERHVFSNLGPRSRHKRNACNQHKHTTKVRAQAVTHQLGLGCVVRVARRFFCALEPHSLFVFVFVLFVTRLIGNVCTCICAPAVHAHECRATRARVPQLSALELCPERLPFR